MENPPLESVNVPGEVPWHSNVAKTGSGGGWRSSRSTLPETANATSKFKLSSCTGLVMLVGGGGTVVGGGGAGAFWAVTAAAPVRNKSKARMPKCFAEDLAESSPGASTAAQRDPNSGQGQSESAHRGHRVS